MSTSKPLASSSGGGKKNEYAEFTKSALPASREIPRMVIGAIEFCTFFPHHSQWPRYFLRLLRNDWRTPTIVKAQLHARGAYTRENYGPRNAAVRQQLGVGGRWYYGDKNWTQTLWLNGGSSDAAPFPATANAPDMYDISRDGAVWGPSTSNAWTRNMGHAPVGALPTLHAVVNGVVNWPAGNDRGLLTQALEWAVTQGPSYLAANDISQVPAIIANNPTWTLPNEALNANTWDQEALRRLNANVPNVA